MIALVHNLVTAARRQHARFVFRHAVSRTAQLQHQQHIIERELREALRAESAAERRMEAALNSNS